MPMPDDVNFASGNARPNDVVIISGTIGDHGMAILSVREGLEFEAQIESDSAALHELVAIMLEASNDIRVLRDLTPGGVASSLNEIAQSSKAGIMIDEHSVPVNQAVKFWAWTRFT